MTAMLCAFCNEKIAGKPIKQAAEYYCSLECANAASGVEPEEEEYFEEESLDEFMEDEE
jgi:hypothetical protein